MILHIYHTKSVPTYLGSAILDNESQFEDYLLRIKNETGKDLDEIYNDHQIYTADQISRFTGTDIEIRVSNLFLEKFPDEQEICVYRESGITYLCLNTISEYGRVERRMYSLYGNVANKNGVSQDTRPS